MYQEILINVEAEEKRVAVTEDGNLEGFYVERQNVQRLVGNIYKGVIESIVPAIGAAFVNIGLERNGFLYVQDLRPPDYEKISETIERPPIYEGATENNKQSGPLDGKKMFTV